GIALHRGFIPFGGTFLIFSDYMRPAIRLAALTQLRPIYVFTHDSIGLGEDGPTHQPIEQLATLRAIPNMTVIRPSDATEVEAAAPQSWYRWVGENGVIIGIERFGESAPYQRIYQEFGLTVERIVAEAQSRA